jgi:SAM-dependent methyltransferase
MHYYHAYNAHYGALYAQGIPYWSDGPDHCHANITQVVSRLRDTGRPLAGLSVLEVGCGEGHLARALADHGMEYLGIDCSGRAISKARMRARGCEGPVSFKVLDAVHMAQHLAGLRFDLVLDQALLHMLVVDADRRHYLANVRALLKRDGWFVLTNQTRHESAHEGEITSLGEYEDIFGHDLSKPRAWQAWNGAKWVKVTLPSFACRPKRRESYVREFEEAGFVVEKVYAQDRKVLDFLLRRGAG